MSDAAGARLLDQECTFSTLSEELDLDIRLKKGVARLGYVRPTLVQRQCLTLALSQGRDLLVRARTGSGKTLAYCLPILEKILRFHKQQQAGASQQQSISDQTDFVKAVILVPTRELCDQVYSTLKGLMYYCDEVASVAVLGGTAPQQAEGEDPDKSQKLMEVQQEAMLRDKPDIVVSTPAGLWRLVKSGKLHLKNSVESLVVDEADLVLSFGYAQDVEHLTRHMPKICQGFLMSATLTPELDSLKKIVLHSPAILKLEEDDRLNGKHNSSNLSQFYISVPKNDKRLVLYVFLKLGLLKGKGLFFVNSTDSAYRLKLFLEQFHIRTIVLNAELPLASRLSILDQFNVGNFDYLIATDESNTNTASNDQGGKKGRRKRKKDAEYGVSRGVDFQGVSFVVNFDFPISSDSYTHRVGRTARGGSKGVALSFVQAEAEEQHHMLELVQASQPPLPVTQGAHDTNLIADTSAQESFVAQPSLLDFNLKDIEGFRYRVEDIGRSVTSINVQEARAAEVKAEVLNSEKLQSHFSDNPHDLHLLRHDRQTTHATKMQDHLKHVPKYLLPRGMQVANSKKKKKKKRQKIADQRALQTASGNKDPLKTFDGGVTLDGVADAAANDNDDGDEDDGQDEEGEEQVEFEADGDENEYAGRQHEYGHSTANSRKWKMKHKKGQFSREMQRKNASQAGVYH